MRAFALCQNLKYLDQPVFSTELPLKVEAAFVCHDSWEAIESLLLVCMLTFPALKALLAHKRSAARVRSLDITA